MRQHIDTVAWIHIATGAVGVLAALLVGGVIGGVGLFSGDAGTAGVLALVAGFVAVLFGLLSIPALVGGWGLLRRKPWARMLVLIVSFLSLPGFPIGTLIGAYSIWVLMNDESRQILSGGDSYPPLPR
ncbi:MAG: hypothetical protein ICV87_03110 [Gemmatimonadetes bacterium]|nr:hypothetical protein [Gemmatimonadota bacterium]